MRRQREAEESLLPCKSLGSPPQADEIESTSLGQEGEDWQERQTTERRETRGSPVWMEDRERKRGERQGESTGGRLRGVARQTETMERSPHFKLSECEKSRESRESRAEMWCYVVRRLCC